MKTILAGLVLALAAGNVAAAEATCAVNVTNDPVVIRMDKDEFRIAFGVAGDACAANGCTGVIRYHAAWRTEDGTESVDNKVLSYDIPSGAKRSITVDRHYFDTSEGRHMTDLVDVKVDDVSCEKPRLSAAR
jgi:hypothetical protein